MTGLLAGSRPPRRKPAMPSQQQFLEPERQTWGWTVAGLLAATTIAVGVFILIGNELLAIVAGVVLPLLAVTVGIFGARDARRTRLIDKLVEALSPMLGSKMDRKILRADRWSNFWDGTPGRIRLRYVAGIDDTDPQWLGEIRSHLARRLGVEFDITTHNRKKCVIELQPSPEAEETEAPSEVAVRAERVVTELLGSPAQPAPEVTMEWNGEELKALEVKHSVGTRMSRPIYRTQVERTLSTMLPGRWRARWNLEEDSVRFEIRPTLPASIPHPIPLVTNTNIRETYSNLEIPYGIDEDGHTMSWTPSVNPHLLVVGTSGSGKTVTMQGILAELAKRGARIAVNDAKLIEFLGFKDWPNVEVVAGSLEEQVRLIHYAHELQEERYEQIVNGEASEDDFEPYFLFLDEYADFREALGDWYLDVKQKGDPTKPPALKKNRSVARKGRTARVHMATGLQRPDAEFLTGEVRDNYSARISMGRLSPQGALMMWENASTGVSLPRKSRGRGITLNDDSQPVEFQSFWTPDPRKVKSDDVVNLRILNGLRPTEVRHERMMIVPPKAEADLDSDTGEMIEPSYSEWASAKIVPYDRERAAGFRPKLTLYPGGGQPTKAAKSAGSTKLALLDRADDVDEVDLEDGYGDVEDGLATSLRPGDLVLIDNTLDLWAVVESAEPDVVEEDYICVDYRTDDGDEGSISIPDDQTLLVRKPVESK